MSIFNKLPKLKRRSSRFNLSFVNKFTTDFGKLVPFFVQEVVPGDKFKLASVATVKFNALTFPVFHNINVFMHYFYVPNRLVFEDWNDFITGGKNGDLDVNFPKFSNIATLTQDTAKEKFGPGTLSDFLGVPFNASDSSFYFYDSFSQLPFRAYQMIYNEYYRDENLEDPLDIPTDSKDVTLYDTDEVSNLLLTMRYRAYEKDRFTSSLPFAQRGSSVVVPLSSDSKVGISYSNDGTPDDLYFQSRSGSFSWSDKDDEKIGYNFLVGTDFEEHSSGDTASSPFSMANMYRRDGEDLVSSNGISIDNSSKLSGTFSEGGINIEELRNSNAIQAWLEANARGGIRPIEMLANLFGVRSRDSRLQRPEYIGGCMSPVVISEVLQQSQSDKTPLGDFAGYAVNVSINQPAYKFVPEHGFIIGIMSIMPRTGYFQGFPKYMFKFDKFDYFFPQFAHLGEEPVLNKELFASSLQDNNNDGTFGYLPRYYDYKTALGQCHGQFKSSLMDWHLDRYFESSPALSEEFIKCKPENNDRIFAVQSSEENPETDHIMVQVYNDVKASRPMPKFVIPKF